MEVSEQADGDGTGVIFLEVYLVRMRKEQIFPVSGGCTSFICLYYHDITLSQLAYLGQTFKHLTFTYKKDYVWTCNIGLPWVLIVNRHKLPWSWNWTNKALVTHVCKNKLSSALNQQVRFSSSCFCSFPVSHTAFAKACAFFTGGQNS